MAPLRPDAQVGAEPLEQLERVLVALARRGHHVAAAHLAARRSTSSLPSRTVRVVLGELRGVALERQAAAERLEAAPVRAGAGAVGAVPVDHLRGRARRRGRVEPRKIEPSITTPPPTPVPSVYITRCSRRAAVHEVRLGERGAVGVVVHVDGHPESLAQLPARAARPRAGCSRSRRPCRSRSRSGWAGRRLPPRLALALDHLAHDRLDLVDQGRRCCSARSAARRPTCTRCRRSGPRATLVPPTSTPMTMGSLAAGTASILLCIRGRCRKEAV